MGTNVINFKGGAMSKKLRGKSSEAKAITDEISGGFSILSFRGKVWRIRQNSEETPLINDGVAVSKISVIVVKSAVKKSKTFYPGGYEEGANDEPTCSSADGLAPDAHVSTPQSTICATCPQNIRGSATSMAGKATTACKDNWRLAVVPENDMQNKLFGGPMLLRIPPATLKILRKYVQGLIDNQFEMHGVVTQISFDPEATHPQLQFMAERPISDAEADVILELRDTAIVADIIGGGNEAAPVIEAKAEEVAQLESQPDLSGHENHMVQKDPSKAPELKADKKADKKAKKAAKKLAKAKAKSKTEEPVVDKPVKPKKAKEKKADVTDEIEEIDEDADADELAATLL